jgi:uncharacterized protein YjbI with pentapeptide repeats
MDPKDVGELQKALSDASAKAAVLWTTFVTFQLYLAIAFGSVTHRNLFLEDPIKLPLLNVDLPLVGFFVVAPIVLVIFHFYVLLQLLALTKKANHYDTILTEEAPLASDRQYLRHRLDSFFVLQLLAGPTEQRTGVSGFSLRLIFWITLVGAPLLILLQGQLTFLPYHREPVVWLQRATIFIDVVIIWYFWGRIRIGDASPWGRTVSKALWIPRKVLTFCVLAFSIMIATFPGEWAYRTLTYRCEAPALLQDDPTKKRVISLHELLFAGAIDEVTSRPGSLFSNLLVLNDQSFVDHDKLDKLDISRSFRGRDLRQAVLNGADLRKADFRGAMLDGATIERAKLQKARFGCATVGQARKCTSLRGARFGQSQMSEASLGGAQLQGASFDSANLQGADLEYAELQGAWLYRAGLQGANLERAELQGASLFGAELQGATLDHAKLDGVLLDAAHLQGTSLNKARLYGASLEDAKMQGTVLDEANLWLASLKQAQLQGASLDDTHLTLASLASANVWRVQGNPNLDSTDVLKLDSHKKPWETDKAEKSTFAAWRDSILKVIPAGNQRDLVGNRLSILDPTQSEDPNDTKKFWTTTASAALQDQERDNELAEFLASLACSSDLPYVARGLLNSLTIRQWFHVASFADKLRARKLEKTGCPGVKGFTDEDWSNLDYQVHAEAGFPSHHELWEYEEDPEEEGIHNPRIERMPCVSEGN